MCWQELRQGWRYTYATFVDDDVEAEDTGGRRPLTAEDFVAYENKLLEYLPVMASPGTRTESTLYLTGHFWSFHAEAYPRLLPYRTSFDDNQCWWGSLMWAEQTAALLYPGHVLHLDAGFTAVEDPGTYPRKCDATQLWVVREMQKSVPEELAPCVVPTPEHTAHLVSLASLCGDAAEQVSHFGEDAFDAFPEQFLEDCMHIERNGILQYGAGHRWGTVAKKGSRSYAAQTFAEAPGCLAEDLEAFEAFETCTAHAFRTVVADVTLPHAFAEAGRLLAVGDAEWFDEGRIEATSGADPQEYVLVRRDVLQGLRSVLLHPRHHSLHRCPFSLKVHVSLFPASRLVASIDRRAKRSCAMSLFLRCSPFSR